MTSYEVVYYMADDSQIAGVENLIQRCREDIPENTLSMLTVSFDMPEIFKRENEPAMYGSEEKTIWLRPESTEWDFYHELSHYLDDIAGRGIHREVEADIFMRKWGVVRKRIIDKEPAEMVIKPSKEVVIIEIGDSITAYIKDVRATAELSRLNNSEAIGFGLEPNNWFWFNRLINQSGKPRIGTLLLDEVLKYCSGKSYSILNQVNAYGDISQKELEDWYIRKGFTIVNYEKYGNALLKWLP